MSYRARAGRKNWLIAALLLGVLAVGRPMPAAAADADAGNVGSLKMIPENAAFYTSMLRNREQVEAFIHSKAFARLKALPAVQMGLKHLHEELHKPGNPASQFIGMYQMPENRQLMELLADMGSAEIFIYGGNTFTTFFQLFQKVGGTAQNASLTATLQGGNDPQAQQLAVARACLSGLADNLELVKVPELIIGFHVDDTTRAETQLQRLQGLLEHLISQAPPLKGRLKRGKSAGGEFLTLTLDGQMVPWQQIPWQQIEEKPGQYDELQKKLAKLKLTISVGVRGSYVLLAIGESTQQIARLGSGPSLADRPEMKPLAKFADKRLTSIGYVSKAFLSEIAWKKKDVDKLLEMASGYMIHANLPQDLQDKLRKDLQDLAKDVEQFIPEVGAASSFSFLSDRGQESYSYDWTQPLGSDASKPLTLLDHLGGNPIFAVVSRAKYQPENYQLLVKWLKRGYGYVESYVLPNLDEARKSMTEKVAEVLFPLLKRFDKATADLLLPGFADGQTALVLDAKIKSKQWHQAMPATPGEMPMLEPALVCGVSDPEKVRKAFAEYRSILNDGIAKLREAIPIIPPFELPEPETLKAKNGTLYFYPLPPFLGLDEQISPNAGLSAHVATFALTHAHSERLLARTPLKVQGGPLADLTKPRSDAAYLNWPELVEAVTPWVEFGVTMSMRQSGGEEQEADDAKKDAALSPKAILEQVRVVLDVLKCLKGYSSSTTIEDGVQVTHSEIVVEDR